MTGNSFQVTKYVLPLLCGIEEGKTKALTCSHMKQAKLKKTNLDFPQLNILFELFTYC